MMGLTFERPSQADLPLAHELSSDGIFGHSRNQAALFLPSGGTIRRVATKTERLACTAKR
jgi:hypothetical protein